VILSGRQQAREITAGMASAGLFPLIGAAPLLGRNFRPDEDQPARRAAAIDPSVALTPE